MNEQIPLGSESLADNPQADEQRDDHTRELLSDVAYKRLGIVNVAFYGKANAGDGAWVLIDAGVAGTAGMIRRAAEKRFGKDARPAAIIMTHGHFDHAGALETLAENWDVPIYAHPLELPYLNGTASYPPPDPSVGGGLIALLSPMYPRHPYDVSRWLQPLPEEGKVPHMPGWNWIHVPGHTPGQVALWREGDGVLLPADAFITTRQESAYAVAVQKPELHGPPAYFTQDWEAARASVERLAALEPEMVVTGHGPAMQGPEMREALHQLARNFEEIAVPEEGQYVRNPTMPESGDAYRSS
ncbi:MAG: MBL fold metallo-hydrolase [Verrucomicrobiota bacterium]|nr:MBL fold metallo-hydrolase [Verrucomicrobiota bacterium]